VDQQGDLDAVVEVELGEDGRDVGLDGGDAEVEHRPDLGVGPALADRDGDLAFAFVEQRQPVPRVAAAAVVVGVGDPGAAALVASSLFFARPESWLGVAMGVGLVVVMGVVVAGWSRRAGWGGAHRLALAGGALLTYAWGGFVLPSLEGAATTLNLAGQAALVLGAAALLTAAARAVGRAVGAAA
jgi:hypothetical protein